MNHNYKFNDIVTLLPYSTHSPKVYKVIDYRQLRQNEWYIAGINDKPYAWQWVSDFRSRDKYYIIKEIPVSVKFDTIDKTLPYERRYWPGFMLDDTRGQFKVVKYAKPIFGDLVICRSYNWAIHTMVGMMEDYYWIVEQLPKYEIKTCTNIWDKELSKYVTVPEFQVRVYNEPAKPGEYAYFSFGPDSCITLTFYINSMWNRCEFVNGNPLETISYKFTTNYVNKYKIGQIISYGDKQYEIIKFDIPDTNDNWIVAEFTPEHYTVVTKGSLLRQDYGFGFKRYIVKEISKFEIKTCTRIYDYSKHQYVSTEPFQIRVYNERPKCGDSGYLEDYATFNTSCVLPDYPDIYNVARDWKRCEFVNDNPLNKPKRPYETAFKRDEIITDSFGKQWVVIAYRSQLKSEHFISAYEWLGNNLVVKVASSDMLVPCWVVKPAEDC